MTKNSHLEPFFWQNKRLEHFTTEEWEALCDRCGRCCLHKIEDEDTSDIYVTSVGCKLLNKFQGRCSNYNERHKFVSDCIKLNVKLLKEVRWLPKDCAYRLIDEGKPLKWWHYLVSHDCNTVHKAGISVKNKIKANEDELTYPEEFLNYIITKIE